MRIAVFATLRQMRNPSSVMTAVQQVIADMQYKTEIVLMGGA